MEIGERWTRGCLLGVFSFLLFSSMTQVQAPTTHTTHVNDTTTKPIEESSSTTTTTTKRATTATTSSSSSFSPTKHETTSSSSSNNQNSTTPTNSSSNSNNKATVIAVVIVVVVVIIIVVVVVVVCIRKRNRNTDSSSDTGPNRMPRVSYIDGRDTPRNDVIEMTSHPRTDDSNDVYVNVNRNQPRRDVSVGDATGDDVRGGSPQSIYVNGTGAVNWRSACALQPEAETIYSNEPDVNSSQWGGRHHPESANGAGSGVAEGFDPSSSSPPEIEDIYLNEPDMNSPQWHSRPDASSRESSTYLNPEDLKMIQLINRANLSIYHAS